MKSEGLKVEIISCKQGRIRGANGKDLEVDDTFFLTSDSVLFDAVYAVGGKNFDEKFNNDALCFVKEAYKHYKPIGASFEGKKWLEENQMEKGIGVVVEDNENRFIEKFLESMLAHRHWNRCVY